MTACKDVTLPGPSSPVITFGVSPGTVNFVLRDINAMSPDDMAEPVFNGGTNKYQSYVLMDSEGGLPQEILLQFNVVVNFSYGYLYSIYLRFNVQYDTLLLPNLG